MGKEIKPSDLSLGNYGMGMDHGVASNISSLLSTYKPMRKTFYYALDEKSYKDILKRATEIDSSMERELKTTDPFGLRRAYAFLSGLFKRYEDRTFAMILGERPYEKGALANTVCECGLKNFDDRPEDFRDLINEEYGEERKASHITVGMKKGVDEKTIEVLEEPEVKKLLDDYKKYTPASVLDVRLFSVDPEQSHENIENINKLNQEMKDGNYIVDPMTEAAPDVIKIFFELELEDTDNLLRNMDSMNKYMGKVERFVQEETGERAEEANKNTAKLLSEELDYCDRKFITRASSALPEHIDKVSEEIHRAYRLPTPYSGRDELHEMDWRDVVETVGEEVYHPRII